MQKISLLLFTFIFSLPIHSWVIDGVGDYQFKQINDKVYVIHGPLANPNPQNQGFINNPGIIVGKTGVIVVDSGSTYQIGKQVIKEIKKITDKPIIGVFNTHVHGDHWLANQAIIEHYPNAKIYAHPKMIAEVKAGAGDDWIEIMNNLTEGLSKGTKAVYPTNSITHLQEITLGSELFRIHSPNKKSHTDTDIMIEHTNSKTLFLGDNGLLDRLARFTDSSDMHNNIKALKYAINLSLTHYVPGHGNSGNADETVSPFLDYLLIIKEVTQKGYQQDLADYEIKPFADKKLAKYRNWHGYDTQLGKHIGKMLLEIEALDL